MDGEDSQCKGNEIERQREGERETQVNAIKCICYGSRNKCRNTSLEKFRLFDQQLLLNT